MNFTYNIFLKKFLSEALNLIITKDMIFTPFVHRIVKKEFNMSQFRKEDFLKRVDFGIEGFNGQIDAMIRLIAENSTDEEWEEFINQDLTGEFEMPVLKLSPEQMEALKAGSKALSKSLVNGCLGSLYS